MPENKAKFKNDGLVEKWQRRQCEGGLSEQICENLKLSMNNRRVDYKSLTKIKKTPPAHSKDVSKSVNKGRESSDQ